MIRHSINERRRSVMWTKTSLAGVAVFVLAVASMAVPPATAQVKEQTKEAAAKTGNAITDGWITMKIHAQFVPEKALDNSDINVDTTKGMVTLKGTVPTAGARQRAVAIAKATDGVKGVTDNLTIATPPGNAMTDGWIKSKIYGQLITDTTLENDVHVDVSKGVVTLKGRVPSETARTRAVAIAKRTDGVKSVTDSLMVAPAAR
jgi:osmotically-inducible protein OsmY